MLRSLVDTDTLSEIMKGHYAIVPQKAHTLANSIASVVMEAV